MKLVWYFSVMFLIFSILLSNPQKGNLGSFDNEIKLLNPIGNMQKGLQVVITINIGMFFLLTILLIMYSQMYC